ncbi:nuclear pore complex protein NUP160-like [Carica papaya]|uniref:nuclear pore complex protein NUP160-like n=1 Tax=Carica papaya TaxID=3649 RepID=UPI000B8CCA3B|nr:nuclear pore complex protein NUP160-like [Carica papaya]
MAFTVILKFWRGSRLKRELEKAFAAMAIKCCPNRPGPLYVGNEFRSNSLLLTSSENEVTFHGSPDVGLTISYSKATGQWETLEAYLQRYKPIHARLPVIVAETLLRSDPQIELPLWLVDMFKGGQKVRTFGMTGQESSPASLFQLYVDFHRYSEATNLLLEYMETFASTRPVDIINRKRPFGVWFPYTTIERLWCRLDESISSDHMVDQCNKLKKLLEGALLNHLKLLKVDSDDAVSSAG